MHCWADNPPFLKLPVQPVSYLSLALTLGTTGGLVWYYNHLKEQKLAGAAFLHGKSRMHAQSSGAV
jgi:hypothetical protein